MTTTLTQEPNIFDEVTKVLNIINEKYTVKKGIHINAGGCGIFAKLLGNAFTNKGFDVEFVLTFHLWSAGGEQLANEGVNNNDLPLFMRSGWRHILLKVGDKYIDSTGVYNSKADYFENTSMDATLSDPFNIEVLNYMLNKKNRSRWNNLFPRKFVSPISKLITKYLK